MLQEENCAILSTFIKLPLVIKIFVLSFLSDHFTQVLLMHLCRLHLLQRLSLDLITVYLCGKDYLKKITEFLSCCVVAIYHLYFDGFSGTDKNNKDVIVHYIFK